MHTNAQSHSSQGNLQAIQAKAGTGSLGLSGNSVNHSTTNPNLTLLARTRVCNHERTHKLSCLEVHAAELLKLDISEFADGGKPSNLNKLGVTRRGC